MQDPLLCALLDSIGPLVAKIRCVDLTPNRVAAPWFAEHEFGLPAAAQDPTGPGFDLVIAKGPCPEDFCEQIAVDGLLLLESSKRRDGPGLRAGWTRIADVSGSGHSWQLWRRHAAA